MDSYIENDGDENIVYTKEGLIMKLTRLVGSGTSDIYIDDLLREVIEVDWSYRYYGLETDNELYIYPLIYEDCISDLYYELRLAGVLRDQVIFRYLRFKGLNDEKIAKDIIDIMERENRVYDKWMQEAVNNKEFMMMEFCIPQQMLP